MNEKDPIEELFRKEAEDSLFQEKPREIVWQKIETNLNAKTKAPVKDFIQSVWFSAAVFALIAVPYFYFFIENMNQQTQNIEFVKHSVEKSILKDSNHNSKPNTKFSFDDEPIQIVKNKEVIIHNKPNVIPEISATQNSLDVKNEINYSVDDIEIVSVKSNIDSTLNLAATSVALNEIEAKATSAKISDLDSTKLLAKNFTNKSKEIPQATARVNSKTNDVLNFYRSRFTIQDSVNRVSFEYKKNNGNKIVFEQGKIRLTMMRENGSVKILTNSNKIKPEILYHLKNNKELIYNYYINFDAPKNR